MYIYFPKLPYLCTANSKSSFGGLAHLARARHWQCRGDRFESGNLHLIQKKVVFNKDNLFFMEFFLPYSKWYRKIIPASSAGFLLSFISSVAKISAFVVPLRLTSDLREARQRTSLLTVTACMNFNLSIP